MTSDFERQLPLAISPQSAADLSARGVTRAMTRSSAWRRTTRGFFVPADVPDTTAQRIIDVAPLIPVTGALTGWAAAFVHGVDLMDGLESDAMTRLPVTINLGQDLGRADPTGVHFIREQLPGHHRQRLYGLSMTTPMRTAFDGARHAPDLVEAVVFLDLIAGKLDLSLRDLEGWRSPPSRWRGIGQFRRALDLADPRSANAWESRLRMFAMLEAGYPRLVVNRPVFDLDETFSAWPETSRVGGQARASRGAWTGLAGARACEGGWLRRGGLRLAASSARRGWTLVEPAWWHRRRRAA